MRWVTSRLLLVAVVGSVVAAVGPVPAGQASPTTARAAAAAGWSRAGGYVAMGDSYSSGEGTFVYRRATDTASNRCHRSPLAYGPLLSHRKPSLRPFTFVACSGALTRDLYATNHAYASEPAQLQALKRSTRTVTLTVGGNDLGFAQVAAACVQSVRPAGFGCSKNAALRSVVAARLAALAGQAPAPAPDGSAITPIDQVLSDIRQRAPRARIYLAGYPRLFGTVRRDFGRDATAPSGSSCVVNPLIVARIDYEDAQWINANGRALNRVLRAAVRQARADGVRATYVSPSTFRGHGLCDRKTAWINPVLVGSGGLPRSESLHPTVAGHALGYARAFRRAGL